MKPLRNALHFRGHSWLVVLGAGLLLLSLAADACTSAQPDTAAITKIVDDRLAQAKPAQGNISTGQVDTAAIAKVVDDKFSKVDANLPLWAIQPGLGTVMMEYNTRMANTWFAAQAGNWDMAHYQILEMKEAQEVGETTKPQRAEDLKKFEAARLDPLMQATIDKDPKAFATLYTQAIDACNACHRDQKSSDFPQGYHFVKVVPPTEAATKDLDWKGQ